VRVAERVLTDHRVDRDEALGHQGHVPQQELGGVRQALRPRASEPATLVARVARGLAQRTVEQRATGVIETAFVD